MSKKPDILCIGSVLWDVIGRHESTMKLAYDVPGKIQRLPGGVAMNVAMTLTRFGLSPAVLTAIGTDPEGEELTAACIKLGVEAKYAHRDPSLSTDKYMAIEDATGLIAAIADARSLEQSGVAILAPLRDGQLASDTDPWTGVAVLDGNLSAELLAEIAADQVLANADLRVVPASPGKASRLRPIMAMKNAVFYVNVTEAELMLNQSFKDSVAAAEAFLDQGCARVVITDGGKAVCDASSNARFSASPPEVEIHRVTGAGDTFMAAHIASEMAGHGPEEALEEAVTAAAAFVSGRGA